MGTSASSQSDTNVSKSSKESTPKKKANKEDKDKKNKSAKTQQAKDVMISYSHADNDIMQKLRDALEKNGITVWVDVSGLRTGVDFLSNIGQAIIDAKCVISLLSKKTIESKYCQDELALAYVSNKHIFPVGLDVPENLFPLMDTGMRLQLARFEWHLFTNSDEFDSNIEGLVKAMKDRMEGTKEAKASSAEEKEKSKNIRKAAFKRADSMGPNTSNTKDLLDKLADEEHMRTFWERHFQNQEKVSWINFHEAFNTDYGDVMASMFSEDDMVWITSIVRREMNVEDNDDYVLKSEYTNFCTVDGEVHAFWPRVHDEAVQSYTMKEVMNMDSSVRVEAIENLGKFHSPAVVEALLDLLQDKDNNVRTVAAISLARTGANSPRIIKLLLKTLNDKDRLVRESGCLALGHLKAEEAVPKLVQLWRNDFISHVREAAQLALEQIGGTEAEKAMHMTKVLAEEIRDLTKE